MGSEFSQCVHESKRETYMSVQTFNVEVQTPPINDHQKQLLRETWSVVKEDIAKVGVVTFMRLFDKFPDVQDLFVPFRGLSSDELRTNIKLREHGLRVMGTIEKCIARLDKPEKLETLMSDLGQKHIIFDTKIQYFDLIIPQLLHALEPILGDQWTPDVEDTWSDFLKYITALMKQAMII
ncbi:cytoglobin-2-like [Mytilus trossulus]|uniref:cytoglobin-2-like n=1 Tax=Mytilus trossulus TaxID=6551 RepID=UPI003004A213